MIFISDKTMTTEPSNLTNKMSRIAFYFYIRKFSVDCLISEISNNTVFFKIIFPYFFVFCINNNKEGKKTIDGKSKNKQQKKFSLFATNNKNTQTNNHHKHDKLKNQRRKTIIARRINKYI